MKKYLGRLFSVLLILAAAFAANMFNPYPEVKSLRSGYLADDVDLNFSQPVYRYGLNVNKHIVIEEKVKKNEFLADILTAYNVPVKLINQLAALPRNVFDVRKIAPNKKYTLFCSADSLRTAKAFVYEPNPIDYVVFTFDESLTVDVCQREVKVEEKSISGVIQSSLSQTINEMGISHELTNKFVDIFAWQVDFARLQKGDVFKLVYEEVSVEGRPIGVRNINGIYFEHFGSGYYAIPFDQGNGLDYFGEDGKSLRKALLKYPIEFTRISSRYTGRRFHPVQKIFKAHLGTDFAAPQGTPIRSVGDGIVEEAQYKSNNGNYVKIRHNGTYTTQYLHMSRIDGSVRAGTRVRQGQVIGYVGSTGLATGPHLCYRFWKNGVQVDALRVELPASEPIKAEYQDAFEEARAAVMLKLDGIASPAQQSFAKVL
ncbi:MAG TPA: peptidoglycan DD-metalloendopeptidase family protein [Cyclobacteriaceae bacterium]|nr:peptidoglycan DD-metalloendopeptidase family protein [Cyclobacteriaceae bacterium]HMV07677.1 peptidoglycan DD-metalloendopeptidase family protein [Cyclobacteriaceae bacterium]HMV88478.1 peptidoglycan DD-metalloendopeptidase family protein [Cyclobacteriaceae bacterium]HMW98812.1 peptidoglycan DD-metalloendopeptidase family protein [Cyclobacteriaceae bacterium]HMX48555.1 peptidoglycan DD-metalloendopeptidase family protein [Cyclobacteriaceae bacterium]